MAPNLPRRPNRAAIARSLREISLLWARPPDPEKDAAGTGRNPEPAAEQSTHTAQYTLAIGESQRGAT